MTATSRSRHTSRSRITAGLVATTVTAAGLVSLAVSNSEANEHPHVLRFGVRFSDPNLVDVPPLQQHPGDFRPGDYVTFGDVLTARHGRRVGTEAGTGTITRVDKTSAQIFYSMAIALPHGRIAASGIGSPDPHKNLVVTGGSGRYLGARGTVRVVERGDGTGTLRITLH